MKVIVIAHNQKELLINWLEIANKTSSVSSQDIIVVDNYSADGLSDYLTSSNYNYLICNEAIESYSSIVNTAVSEFADNENIFITTPTYIPVGNTLDILNQVLLSDSSLCAVSPSTDVSNYTEASKILNESTSNEYAYQLSIDANCIMINYNYFYPENSLDEKIFSPEFVIKDFIYKNINNNLKVAVVTNAFAISIAESSSNYFYNFYENDRIILKDKWNMNYFNTSENYNLISTISSDKDQEFNILEVGCDCGANLLGVKKKYKNAHLYGLELNENSGKIASTFFPTIIGNIENKDVDFGDIKFDYIMFGDVLEHLRDPKGTLVYCLSLLSDGGKIIASIPNLMHWSVMKHLINGYFHYTDVGLLDKTHIHFFTYNEIIRMFLEANYNLEAIYPYIYNDTTDKEKEFIKKLVELSDDAESFMFETFHYVVVAAKK